MISPLKFSNTNFQGSLEYKGAYKNFKPYKDYQQDVVNQERMQNIDKIDKIEQDVNKNSKDIREVKKEIKENKPSLYRRTKGKILGFFKNLNKIKFAAQSTTKGVAQGLVAFGVTAFVGKNLQDAVREKNPMTFFNGAMNDICKFAGAAGRNIEKFPKTLTDIFAVNKDNSVLKDTGLIFSRIFKTIGGGITKMGASSLSYLKNNKIAAAAALTIAGTVLLKNIIQGKIKANERNADLDHKFDYGHVK